MSSSTSFVSCKTKFFDKSYVSAKLKAKSVFYAFSTSAGVFYQSSGCSLSLSIARVGTERGFSSFSTFLGCRLHGDASQSRLNISREKTFILRVFRHSQCVITKGSESAEQESSRAQNKRRNFQTTVGDEAAALPLTCGRCEPERR